MFRTRILLTIIAVAVLAAGCSHEAPLTTPVTGSGDLAKDGTEVLGPPSMPIAEGSGFANGGVGMVGIETGQLTVEVPAGAQVVQAILYWAGGSSYEMGDDTISLDGQMITGELIGGPVSFFRSTDFFAYRADITNLGLVSAGTNSFTVADLDFTTTTLDENNGATILVIYDDGTTADITLRDGLDMAYFGYEPTLDATVPQVFGLEPAEFDRTAQLTIIAASLGQNRPSVVKVTTSAGDQLFEDVLGSLSGLVWDSLTLEVEVPAGSDELSVQVISSPDTAPAGGALGWVAAGLALESVGEGTFSLSGVVFEDATEDAYYDGIEWGIGGVVVELKNESGTVATSTTDFYGTYEFEAPAGDYTVEIDLTGYPDDFNANLGDYFDATTPLSVPVTVGLVSSPSFFGFIPRVDDIIYQITEGNLPSNGKDGKWWKKVFRGAGIQEQSNRQGEGHDHEIDSGGWGHMENFPSGDELLGFLDLIESLYIQEPYQFTDGLELKEVYAILASKPKDDYGLLYRELLITELNYAAGYGLVGEEDIMGVLISWGESMLAAEEDPVAKAGTRTLKDAFFLFATINTGGGGGVDE